MPQLLTDQNNSDNDIKVKTAYNGNIMITYVKENVTYEELCREIRGICRFSPDQVNRKSRNRIGWIVLKKTNLSLLGVHFEMGGRRKWSVYNVIANRTAGGNTTVRSESWHWTCYSWWVVWNVKNNKFIAIMLTNDRHYLDLFAIAQNRWLVWLLMSRILFNVHEEILVSVTNLILKSSEWYITLPIYGK